MTSDGMPAHSDADRKCRPPTLRDSLKPGDSDGLPPDAQVCGITRGGSTLAGTARSRHQLGRYGRVQFPSRTIAFQLEARVPVVGDKKGMRSSRSEPGSGNADPIGCPAVVLVGYARLVPSRVREGEITGPTRGRRAASRLFQIASVPLRVVDQRPRQHGAIDMSTARSGCAISSAGKRAQPNLRRLLSGCPAGGQLCGLNLYILPVPALG